MKQECPASCMLIGVRVGWTLIETPAALEIRGISGLGVPRRIIE